jgi:hypothetical protein
MNIQDLMDNKNVTSSSKMKKHNDVDSVDGYQLLMEDIELLNEEQRGMIDEKRFLTEKTPILLIACAGSGKTRVVVLMIAYMVLKYKCNPLHFYISTFTNAGSEEMKTRLRKYLTKRQITELIIGTFHAIAKKKLGTISTDIHHVVQDSHDVYLANYCEALKAEGDNGSRYIFVDEYQDIDDTQNEIIEQLYTHARLLVAVGDDQQNIYTFRKTNIKHILNFEANHENAIMKQLIKNYRSQAFITEFANIVLKYNKNKIDKTIISANDGKRYPIVIYSYYKGNECGELLEKFKDVISKKGYEGLHNYAIIARNNYILNNIEQAFAAKNIPTHQIKTESDNQRARNGCVDNNGRVVLSSMHGVKGLEYDNVFIIEMNQGTIPGCSDEEEERRLFYVSVTRAKKKLYIGYEENKASTFLNEVMSDPDSKNIILKHELGFTGEKGTGVKPAKHVVDNAINKLNINDYNVISNEIFNHKIFTPIIETVNIPIQSLLLSICDSRKFFVSNIHSTFNMMLKTLVQRHVSRHIATANGTKIIKDDFYYLAACIARVKYQITRKNASAKKESKGNNYIDERGILDKIMDTDYHGIVEYDYAISLSNFNEIAAKEVVEYIVNAYTTSIMTFDYRLINDIKRCYQKFKSSKTNSQVLSDLFVISVIKEFHHGRKSLQHVMNFSDVYDTQKLNRSDFEGNESWINEIETTINSEIYDRINPLKDEIKMLETQYIISDVTGVVAMIDLIIDDCVYEIEPSASEFPEIHTVLKILGYASMLRRKGIIMNMCCIYNPLLGKMFRWDISTWMNHDKLVEHYDMKLNEWKNDIDSDTD